MTQQLLDGAEMAILINRIEGIARKMTNTLYRTGRSGVLNRARDFSCCIVTSDCDLLATADSLPIHVLVGPNLMAHAMKQFHPCSNAATPSSTIHRITATRTPPTTRSSFRLSTTRASTGLLC